MQYHLRPVLDRIPLLAFLLWGSGAHAKYMNEALDTRFQFDGKWLLPICGATTLYYH